MSGRRNVLIIDVESTCDPSWNIDKNIEDTENYKGEIIEIGLAVWQRHTAEAVTSLPSIFIMPVHSLITEFCTELTGISHETFSDPDNKVMRFPAAASHLSAIYHNYQCSAWASWGDYDRRMLQHNCKIDEVEKWPLGHCHINAKMLHFLLTPGLKKPLGVGKALAQENLNFKGRQHSGKDDAYNIARLYNMIVFQYPRSVY